jgi:hypothetical protein
MNYFSFFFHPPYLHLTPFSSYSLQAHHPNSHPLLYPAGGAHQLQLHRMYINILPFFLLASHSLSFSIFLSVPVFHPSGFVINSSTWMKLLTTSPQLPTGSPPSSAHSSPPISCHPITRITSATRFVTTTLSMNRFPLLSDVLLPV